MTFNFGDIVLVEGIACFYCAPCPVKPGALSIVLPVNDINNPIKALNASLCSGTATRAAA